MLCGVLSGCGKTEGDPYPCFVGVPESNGLPTILVIGDSISIGYTPYLQSALLAYDVVHNPCNARTSGHTRESIDAWLSSRASFEAITWNNGLWDVAQWEPTDDETYINNLRYIAQRIKAKTAKPLFLTTTEVLSGTPDRIEADVVHKNSLAVAVMASEGIPVLDLHAVSVGIAAEHINAHDVHFTEQGSSDLADAILAELNTTYGIN